MSYTRLGLIVLVLTMFMLNGQIVLGGDHDFNRLAERCRQIDIELDIVDCESYSRCQYRTENCSDVTLISSLKTCNSLDLGKCAERTVLYFILLRTLFSENWHIQLDAIQSAITAFESDNMDQALIDYLSAKEDDFPYYWYEVGAGILYFANGQDEQAIEQYSQSIDINFYNALAYYFRGLAYEANDQPDRAVQDFYTYTVLASTAIEQAFLVDEFKFQLDYETWIAYPLLEIYAGSGGLSFADLSLLHTEVYWDLLNNGTTLAIANMNHVIPYRWLPPILFLEQDTISPEKYTQRLGQQPFVGSLLPDGQTIEINIFETHLEYNIYLEGGEGQGRQTGIIYPPAMPEPFYSTFYPCRGLGRSMIRVDDIIRDIYDSSTVLYSFPSLQSNIANKFEPFQRMTLTVLSGPSCSSTEIWWYVTDNNYEGWIPETMWLEQVKIFRYRFVPVQIIEKWASEWGGQFPSPLEVIEYDGE